MSALNIKKGSSSHSACDRRDPSGPVTEMHRLAALIQS
jgi:acetolactate synthase-1/3 small subunit